MFYIDNADTELMLYCLENANESFLKYSFRKTIFSSTILAQPTVINYILRTFKLGMKTELLLNLLIFADFRRWE